MTISEFKAWLEGFEEAFATDYNVVPETRTPNPDQWRVIKRKLAAVTDRTAPNPFNGIFK